MSHSSHFPVPRLRWAGVLSIVFGIVGISVGQAGMTAWRESAYGEGLPVVDSTAEAAVTPATDLATLLADGNKYRYVLAPGNYGPLEIAARAGEDVSRPLVIMADNPTPGRHPVFTARVVVTRPNVYLYGLYFKGTEHGDDELEFLGGVHRGGGKVLRCYFEGATADFDQADMEVAYNEVWDVDGIGFEFRFPMMRQVAWDVDRGKPMPGWEPGAAHWKKHPTGAFRAHVHHNHFRDWRGEGNGHEAFRIGQSSHHRWWEAQAIVERNYLENIRVPGENEAISIKSSGNIVRHNTLVETATLSLRVGLGNRAEANYLVNTSGLVVMDGRTVNGHSRGHLIIGNYLENAERGLHLYAGFCDPERTLYVWNKGEEELAPIPASYETPGFPLEHWNHVSRPAARHAIITDNILQDSPIEVGRRVGDGHFPVTGTVLWGNVYRGESQLIYGGHADTVPAEGEREGALAPVGYEDVAPSSPVPAFRLTPREVGPAAFAEAWRDE